MNKKYFLPAALLFILISTNAAAQSALSRRDNISSTLAISFPFTDGFENGLSNWIVSGQDWDTTSIVFRSGGHCITDSRLGNYPLDGNATITLMSSVNLSASVSPVLRFWHKYSTSSYDYCYVEISTNGGSTWTLLRSYTYDMQSTWTLEQIDLKNYKTSTVKIRFRLLSDGSNVNDGWYLDDIEIKELEQSISYPFADGFENGLGNWAVSGQDWDTTSTTFRSGGHCVTDSRVGNYPLDGNATITLLNSINLSTSISPVLRFWHKYSTSSYDYCYVEISTNGGSSWTLLRSYTYDMQSTWTLEQIDLKNYKTSTVKIRFRLLSDGSNVNDGWYLDDIEIKELEQSISYPFADGFENGLGNWAVSGQDWDTTSTTFRSGGHCVTDSRVGNYPLDGNATITLMNSINLNTSISPILRFWHKYSTSSYDYCYVEISTNGGSSWTLLRSYTYDMQSTWTLEQIDLKNYKTSTVKIRFRLRSDGSNVNDGWYLDDIEIKELEQSISYPFADGFENGLGNWAVSGQDWDTTSTTFRSGGHCVTDSRVGNYPLDGNATITLLNSINLSTSISPVLRFWHKYSTSSYDYCYVEISTNGGTTWTSIHSYSYDIKSNWALEQYDLTNYKVSAVKVRFRLRSDGSNVNDGWYIDDVELTDLQAVLVKVVSPNGGENWQINSTQNILWSSSNIGNVKLEYTIDNGITWTVIIASTPASAAKYSWTVPNSQSIQCKIRISDAVNSSIQDISDNVFSIGTNAVPINPPLTITSFSPTSGPIGTTVTITGTNFNTTAANNIVYFGAVKGIVTTATSNELRVTVPAGATYNYITITDISTGLIAFSTKQFILTFPGSHAIDSTSFAAGVNYPCGYYPMYLVSGDIDGDGKPDLVVTNLYDNTLSVIRNTSSAGNLSFAAKVNFPTEMSPNVLAMGDLDGDGKLDIIDPSKFSVFRNTSTPGNPFFADRVVFSPGVRGFYASAADLDGDGKSDVVIANYDLNTISVFRNTSTIGTISFAPKVDYGTGAHPHAVAIGDLDGDGKLDMAVANDQDDSFSIYRNMSTVGSITTQSFANKIDFMTPQGLVDLMIGDLDSDNKLDIVVTTGATPVLTLYRNIATPGNITTGSFATGVGLTTIDQTGWGTIGDLDGDSKPDIVLTSYIGKAISVYRNSSTSGSISAGSFATRLDIALGAYIGNASVVDLDGDGKSDIAIVNNSNDAVSVLRNTMSAGNIAPAVPQNLTATAGNVQVLLKWKKNTEVDFLKYRIYVGSDSTSLNLKDSTIASISDTTKVITGLTNGTKYYFRVSALDSARLESGQSVIVSAVPSNLYNGLVAWYPFNGNSNDSCGNGNNGTNNGATLTMDRFGNIGKAYYFNGINNYIQVPNSTTLQSPTTAMTLAGWINIESWPGLASAGIMEKTNTTTDGQYGLYYAAFSTPAFWFSVGLLGSVSAPFNVQFNQWYFIAGSWDGGTGKLYVNDQLVQSQSITGTVVKDSNPLYLGLASPTSAVYLKGKLDDIRIYNRALTQTEISQLYTEDGWGNLNSIISLSATTIVFGSITSGSTTTKSLVITNMGTAGLTGTVSVTSNAGYSINKTSISIAAGGKDSVLITFSPTATQNYNATLTVTHNAAGSPSSVTLSGTGIPPSGNPVLSLSKSSVLIVSNGNFSSAVAGSVNAMNNGNAALTGTVSFSGSPYISVSPNTLNVSAGSYTVISISISSVSVADGTYSGTITIVHNAQGSPTIIPVEIRKFSIPSTFTVNHQFSFASFKNGTDYQLIGIPGIATIPASTIFSGTYKQEWRMYRDNGTPSNYLVEYDNNSANFNFGSGKGFWVLANQTYTYSATLPNYTASGACPVSLQSGWNIITNPYARTVLWSDVQSYNLFDANAVIYSWNNGLWSQATSLVPYRGYYFYNTGNASALSIPYNANGALAKQISLAKEFESVSPPVSNQHLRISLSAGESEPSSVYIGIDEHASNNYDTKDYFAPPASFAVANIQIDNSNLSTEQKRLCVEHRCSIGEGQQFNLIVKNTAAVASLSVEGIANFPDDQIFLLDEQNNELHNLKLYQHIDLPARSEECRYSVLIGGNKLIETLSGTIVPNDYSLTQNYPNPFNPTTMITYRIPKLTYVSLKVYDVMGREVTPLVHETKAAGSYTVQFNAGKLCGGVYFYRLQTDNFVLTKKLILLK